MKPNEPTTQEWIKALEECLSEKWNALAEGLKPETTRCAACTLWESKSVHDASVDRGYCPGCPLDGDSAECCNGLFHVYDETPTAKNAIPVRDFIASKLADFRLKRAREVCRDDPETEEAMRESKVHWKEVMDWTGMMDVVDTREPNSSNCALCRRCQSAGCKTCPICIRSGKPMCDVGPYMTALSAWKRRRDYPDEHRFASQAMIDYLEEMDPKYLGETAPKAKHAEPAKPKAEKVLVPFRPDKHNTFALWRDGEFLRGIINLDEWNVTAGELHGGGNWYGEARRMEIRVPPDWTGPVPDWGRWVVPVVTGGPWHESGNVWEHWREGKPWCCCKEYRVHEGRLEARGGTVTQWEETTDNYSPSDLVHVRLHAPRGWTGPIPKGCCLLDERAPVERVSREVMEEFAGDNQSRVFIAEGSNLLMLYDDFPAQTWRESWQWKVFERNASSRRCYAFLLDTDTQDHGPLDEDRFFWAAGSEPKAYGGEGAGRDAASAQREARQAETPAPHPPVKHLAPLIGAEDTGWDEDGPYRRIERAANGFRDQASALGDSLVKALEQMKREDWGPRP